MYISTNRYEWSHRRVLELQDEIKTAKQELSKTKGFFQRIKVKRKLTKLIKLQNKHGNEMLEYERLNN